MGLDMYLNGKRFLSRALREEDESKQNAIAALFPELEGQVGRWGNSTPVNQVEIEVGYWRKANHIHEWFVQNVQGGTDNCGHYYVSREQLDELRDLCQQVLDNRSQAETLLPTASGFFFGGTEYDDYYFRDLQETIKIIDRALSLPRTWDFEYHSSW